MPLASLFHKGGGAAATLAIFAIRMIPLSLPVRCEIIRILMFVAWRKNQVVIVPIHNNILDYYLMRVIPLVMIIFKMYWDGDTRRKVALWEAAAPWVMNVLKAVTAGEGCVLLLLYYFMNSVILTNNRGGDNLPRTSCFQRCFKLIRILRALPHASRPA